MFISSLLVATGSAVVGYIGIDYYLTKRNAIPLARVLYSSNYSAVAVYVSKSQQQVTILLKQTDDRYQMVLHNTVDRLFGTQYEKHLQALGGTTGVDAIPPLVKQRNRDLGYASIALVLVLTGVPLLVAISLAINLYLNLVLIRIGLRDMRQKRGLTARGRGAIFALAILASGFLAFNSVIVMFGLLIEKLIATVQGQAHERLVNVFGTLPQTVALLQNGVIVTCPLGAVERGDVVVVRAGEVIPVDGEILQGHASVDQHILTGEAQPVEKAAGDSVLASTLVLMGEIQVRVAQANRTTLAAQITEILNNTRSYNTQVGLKGLAIADRWVYVTTGLGLLALPFWGVSAMLAVWGTPVGSFLMGTTPLTLLGYLEMSARSNILVKDGRSLDLLGEIDTVVFDKTGTLTLDQPTVCDIHVSGDLKADLLLALAAAIEQHQSHPIAAAIRHAAAERGLSLPIVDETRVEVGYGLAVTLESRRVQLGSERYMTLSQVTLPTAIKEMALRQQAAGHSLVYLAVDGILQGAIELQPTLRPEAQAVVTALHARGLQLAMITGDQETPAQTLAATLGIDRVFANVLPEQKAKLVRELQEQGRHVMFVGDGINDSIALKQAHVSVSIAGATTVATDTAQIVLMDGTLAQLDGLFELSHRYERDMQAQYFLGVQLPAAWIGGIVLLGWGLVSTYIIGYGVFFTSLGIAFRPIWRQERLESKHLLQATTNDEES